MLTYLKTLLTSRSGRLAAVAMLLAVLLLAPQPAAVAQEPDDAPEFELSTYQSDSGESTISSQQTVLKADDFERVGTVDNIIIKPEGLSLAQNVEQGVYQSGTIRSPLSFTTDIGLAWLADLPGDAGVSVEARLSSDGESWQDWLPVPVEYYPTPNGEYVGSLIWVNQAETYLQIRLTLQAGGSGLAPLLEQMTLFFNDTSQGPSSQAARAGSVQNSTPEVPVNVCPAKPQVISRTDWGCPTGQESPHWLPSYQPVTHVVISHTATPNTADDWAAVVRSIWHYHAKILYWGDIGYNYLIDPLGNIYEGRAGGDDTIAAFDGFNRGAMGIGYIGCYGNCEEWWFSNADPSPEMIEAGDDLIAWKVSQNDLDPLGSGEYCKETLPTIVGRSQVTCRGHGAHPENLEELLPDIRLAVEERIEACELPPTDPPVIQSVSPGSGFNNNEVTLTVEGTNFQPQDSGFSATLVAADSTETQLALGSLQTGSAFEAIVPAGLPPGLYNLVVTNPDGQFDTAVHAYESLPEGSTDTDVRFSPASLQVGVDSTGQMAVEVANVTNLFGAELQILFDSTVVEVVDADPGAPGTQVAMGSVFEGVEMFNAENSVENGVINFSATRRSPAPAFSGTGSLIQITWRGKTSDQTDATFGEVKLANADGQPISTTVGPPGSIEVGTTVVIMRGQVQLQGRSDSSAATVTAGGQQLHPNSDGSFEMAIAGADTYSLTMTAPGYLSAKAQGDIPPGTTEIDMGSVTLLGGDVTGDDFIDIFDLSFMGSRYGSNNTQADINADGIVDIFDLTMAAANYGQSGPVIAELDTKLRREIKEAGISPFDLSGPAPTPAKVELGRVLFFDKELSGNRDTSCSTCHLLTQHTSDGLSVSVGTGGVGGVGPDRYLGPGRILHPRNSPDAFNRGLPQVTSMFWDSRVSGSPELGFTSPAGDALPAGQMDSILAVLAMFPVTARDEMRGLPDDSETYGNELAQIENDDFTAIWEALTARLLAIPEYVALFNNAYPDTPTSEPGFQHAANAIAAFLTAAFTFVDTPWDQYVAGNNVALSNQAKQGALLFFGKAQCSQCHTGNMFTDQQHHNLAMPQVGPGNSAAPPGADFGRGAITGNAADNYTFRTPPLRNVALTGPWTHAGAYTSLEAVVRHHLNPEQALRNYDPLQLRHDLQDSFQDDEAYISDMLANLDPIVATPVTLTEAEIEQLMAFLHALTDPAAVDLSGIAPVSVPSGLPIDK